MLTALCVGPLPSMGRCVWYVYIYGSYNDCIRTVVMDTVLLFSRMMYRYAQSGQDRPLYACTAGWGLRMRLLPMYLA